MRTTQEWLSDRPRLQERHRVLFESLTSTEVARAATRMEQDMVLPRRLGVPHHADGHWLFEVCRREDLDHASCVFPLCREHDDIGVSALEKLVGKPINVWRPAHRTPTRTSQAASKPATGAGNFSPTQVVLSVVSNPKKVGCAAWHRYRHWVVGETVQACMARGLTRADVLWDIDYSRGFVKLGSREEYDVREQG
jgi:hypothetical protein